MSLLNLRDYGIVRDVRRLIYAKLTNYDLYFVKLAHDISGRKKIKNPANLECYLIEHNYFTLLKWCVTNCDIEISDNCMELAARYGHVNILQYISSLNLFESTDFVTFSAIETGQLQTLQWLLNNGWQMDEWFYATAAGYGQLHILQWLYDIGISFPNDSGTDLFRVAARGGYLDILVWLRKYCCDWDSNTTYNLALSGNLELLQWARDEEIHGDVICPMNDDVYAGAAYQGHLHIIKWVYYNTGMQIPSDTYTNAAEAGHLEILQWLKSKNIPEDLNAPDVAARRGHFEVIKWLHENGFVLNTATVDEAIDGGHLEIVKWLADQLPVGCFANAYASAISADQMEIYDWLMEQEYPLAASACAAALAEDNIELFYSLYCKGCPLDERVSVEAVTHGLPFLKWLHSIECPIDARCSLRAVEYGKMDVLKWLYANRFPMHPDIPGVAFMYDMPKIAKWAIKRGFVHGEHIVREAVESGYTKIGKWLVRHGYGTMEYDAHPFYNKFLAWQRRYLKKKQK